MGNALNVQVRTPAALLVLVLALSAGCKDAGTGVSPPSGKPEPPPKPIAVKPFAMGQPDVVLLITGSNNGSMEICNCSESMPGGLSRRSGLVISYRNAFPHTLLIDSGDLFWIEPESHRNEFVLRGYRTIGYDAVTLADRELGLASAHLGGLLATAPQPYLSTTVSLAAPGKLPSVECVRRQWGDIKVAVVSRIDRKSFLFLGADKLKGLSFNEDRAAQIAAQFKQDGYVVVVVAHGDEESAAATAKLPWADMVVRGHTEKPEQSIVRDGGAPIVKVGGHDYVGAVALKIAGGKIVQTEYRLELVDESWPADKRLLQTYQAYAHAEMRRELDMERKDGLVYLPSSDCGGCHEPQFAAWKSHPHGHAYATLVKAGRAGDPDCLMCHTSGFGTKHGFYTIRKTPKLANVNCQDCHRFSMKDHATGSVQFAKPSEEICTTCHTPVTDPKFNYAEKVKHIHCKGK